MDAKIALSVDKDVIKKTKEFAASQISLSRLTEFLYLHITSGHYTNLEHLPISDWVHQIAEGKAGYATKPRTRKSLKVSFSSPGNEGIP